MAGKILGKAFTGGAPTTSGEAIVYDGTNWAVGVVEGWNGPNTATVGPGWMTIATQTSNRGMGEFYISDNESGDHAFMHIEAYRSYADSGAVVINQGGHTRRITGVRWIEDADLTYGEKKLQVYVTVSSAYNVHYKNLDKISGWTNMSAVTPVIEDAPVGFTVANVIDKFMVDADGGAGVAGTFHAGARMEVNGNEVWHAGNDGAGSGLNADLLDGVEGVSFLQKSGGIMTGDIQFPSDGKIRGPNAKNFVLPESPSGDVEIASIGNIDLFIDSDNTQSNTYFRVLKDGDGVGGSGTEVFKVDEDGDVTVTKDLQLGGWTLRSDGVFFPNVDNTGQVGGTGNRVNKGYFDSLLADNTGAPGAPGYTFIGNTNTGMYQDAANTISFSTSGVFRVRVNDGSLDLASNVILRIDPGVNNSGDIGSLSDYIGNVYVDKIHATTFDRVAEDITVENMSAKLVQAEVVDAAFLNAQAVNAQIITAEKISAEHLSVSTIGDNLVKNPSFEDINPDNTTLCPGWRPVEGGTTEPTRDGAQTSPTGTHVMSITNSNQAIGSTAFPVEPGETYIVGFHVKHSDGNGNYYVRANYSTASPYDSTYTVTGESGASVTRQKTHIRHTTVYDYAVPRDGYTDFVGNEATSTITSWTYKEFTWTVPANTYWASLVFYNWNSSTGDLYVDNIKVRKQMGTVDIKDGSITADSINTNSVATEVLTADTTISGRFRTATSGARFEILGSTFPNPGLQVWDASNKLRFQIKDDGTVIGNATDGVTNTFKFDPTDGSVTMTKATITGSSGNIIDTANLDVDATGNLTMAGTLTVNSGGNVDVSGNITLSSGGEFRNNTNPASNGGLVIDYASSMTGGKISYLNFYYDGSENTAGYITGGGLFDGIDNNPGIELYSGKNLAGDESSSLLLFSEGSIAGSVAKIQMSSPRIQVSGAYYFPSVFVGGRSSDVVDLTNNTWTNFGLEDADVDFDPHLAHEGANGQDVILTKFPGWIDGGTEMHVVRLTAIAAFNTDSSAGGMRGIRARFENGGTVVRTVVLVQSEANTTHWDYTHGEATVAVPGTYDRVFFEVRQGSGTNLIDLVDFRCCVEFLGIDDT